MNPEDWTKAVACAFNHGRECLALGIAACICRRMAPDVYREAIAEARFEAGEDSDERL